MKKRAITFPSDHSFFLFGARGTGKSTLINKRFKKIPHLSIDLLEIKQEAQYLSNPDLLTAEIEALPNATRWILIDEIQKVPALLDVVHSLIEKTNKCFILTGSSARKLKHGHANMLAGRAFVRNLYPFSFIELGNEFDLNNALQFGMLPKIYQLKNDESRQDFLRAYTHIYLKEEVWAEHLIRKLEPFQRFLEVAAQVNGTPINCSNIARDVGVTDSSIAEYFSILEDTLIGFTLPAFRHSFRKRLSQRAKFYLFDVGVVRALCNTLTIPLVERTYDYGNTFEHFIILECLKLGKTFYPDFRYSHLRSNDGLEIDLVIERPGEKLLLIEIKSGTNVTETTLPHLKKAAKELNAECICLANIERTRKYEDIIIYPWRIGIEKFFT